MISCIKISEERLRKLINFSSETQLVIKGRGNQTILNDSFYLKPSKVLVNGKLTYSYYNFCDLEYEENNVTLYFNDSVKLFQYMFAYLDDIMEIDLSFFDFSNVTKVKGKFRNYNSLIEINFGDINKLLVGNMNIIFYQCYKLTSLNLSNVDISLVIAMRGIFGLCHELLSLNLSNFNIKNVESFVYYLLIVIIYLILIYQILFFQK